MGWITDFFLGSILSFLGQLPLGTLSMTATQIAVQENERSAWKYAVGVAFVEVACLRLVLSGMQWFLRHPGLFAAINWVTVVFFLVLGVLSFTVQRSGNQKGVLLKTRIDRLILGVSMSALNPAQIPFWFVWTGYFISQRWLPEGFGHFNVFTLGAGLGTMAGLAVYIYGGTYLVVKMKTSNRRLNAVMGVIFFIAALAELNRILNP